MRDLRDLNVGVASRAARIVGGGVLAFMLVVFSAVSVGAEEVGNEISYDGLKLVKDSNVAKAYIDPEADFSVYKRVKILKPYVAFRKNWRRDQNRERTHRINPDDMERMKTDVASLFETVFSETLQADGGFEVVDVNADDVLLLRPAIIDLDVSAPDTMSPDRSTTYTTTAGAATIYIELFDSVSGRIIGRATDRKAIRDPGNSISWTNRAMNAAEARRVFGGWASLLRTFLDQHYKK